MHTRQLSLFEQYRFGDPTLTDEQVVEAIARQILEDADAKPPVDVEVLASACGINEIEQRQAGPAGMLFRRGGVLVASIHAGDGLERGRFTVLHEGGHTFLEDFLRTIQYRCAGQRTREEYLCDVAAAEMLLPREFFVPDLKQAGVGLQGVEDLAQHYVASHQSTALRVVALTEGTVALLVFKVAHKPSERGRENNCEPRLRLQWSSTTGSWPFVRRHKSADTGSAVERAWQGEWVSETALVDEFFGESLGPMNVDARRYGDTVLVLVRPRVRLLRR
ncbi:ImmA/IrrE family metallo-endopeptidase [Svornostia abyssi]|uniref:ImmA/IrrE family metallo-endopeptidase n=1 Tax=Svornostia abyssi TaxID=2898438 RepID=A0ABY5PAD3_9ACTN|nr:ImmA/IrrE family metallo-endopeptidase [Parviterribacteraceae bacterium J379]